MIKKILKKFMEIVCVFPMVNRWYRVRRYHRQGLPLIMINFIFQRILRYNGKSDWVVNFTSKVTSPDKIIVEDGDYSYMTYGSFAISGGCYIQGFAGVQLGNGVLWAPGVQIISSNHDMKDYTMPTVNKPIVLGEKVWLGANAVILPEVNLGQNVIVAAGSVVSKSFPKNVIVGGIPAKIIGYRCFECGTKLDTVGGTLSCSFCNSKYHIHEFSVDSSNIVMGDK